MKFKLTVEAYYEVPDDRLRRIYGTTDPRECADIDADNDDPIALLSLASIEVWRVDPA